MYSRFALLAALLLLAAPVPAHHTSTDTVIDDPAGDLEAFPGSGDTMDAERHDLRRVWLGHETDDEISVGFVLEDMGDPAVPPAPGSRDRTLRAGFERDDTTFRVSVWPGHRTDEPCEAFLTSRVGNNVTRVPGCLELTVADDTGFVATMPRSALAAGSLEPPLPGEQLMGLQAWSTHPGVPGVVGGGQDQAGPAEAPFRFLRGSHEGALVVSAPDPVRASNGEATTLIYELVMLNPTDEPIHAAMTVATAEPSFNITVPPVVTVPAASDVTVPVVLSMGFQHRHGETGQFEVLVRAGSDGASASVPFGVDWLKVPQPSGHHRTIHFHGNQADPSATDTLWAEPDLWSNTLLEDPDRGASMESVAMATEGDLARKEFPLAPSLLLGLHVEDNGTGHLRIDVESPVDLSDAVVGAELQWCAPAEPPYWPCSVYSGAVPLVAGESDAQDVPRGDRVSFEFDLPTVSSGIIPYEQGANLNVVIDLSWTNGPRPAKELAPRLVLQDAALSLPLQEFHDPGVTQFSQADGLNLSVADSIRHANPGGRVVFEFDVTSPHAVDAVATVVSGHPESFRLSQEEFAVAAGQASTLLVVADVPESMLAGSRLDAVLLVQDRQDPATAAARALSILVVSEDQPIESDLYAPAQSKDSPAPAALVLLAVLGLLGRRGQRLHPAARPPTP